MEVLDRLVEELSAVARHVRRGRVWTTDAPYRETPEQLRFWAERDVLAVEMQAASLFAFARARGAAVATVALVSNGDDQVATGFDTGGDTFRMKVLAAIARAAQTSTCRS
jgi:uridine phosphorylase